MNFCFHPVLAGAQTGNSLITIILLFCLFFVVLYCLTLLHRRCRFTRTEAEARLRDCGDEMRDRFQSLEPMKQRVLEIEAESERFTGKTRELADELFPIVDEMEQHFAEARTLLHEADDLIEPETKAEQLSQIFSAARSEKALDMMSASGPGRTFGEIVKQYRRKEAQAEKLLTRLERGIEGMSRILRESGEVLEDISTKLPSLIDASRSDGYFPLLTIQSKLLVSIDTMLEECARIGATDPVAAFEDPAKLLEKQINNARCIVDTVAVTRRDHLPKVKTARELLNREDISANWIVEEWLIHSKSVETITSYAELWSISNKLKLFEGDIRHSVDRSLNAAAFVERAKSGIIPAINELEKRVDIHRFELSRSLGLNPDQILRENQFDPDLQVMEARQSVGIIRRHLGCGAISAVDKEFGAIDQMIRDTGDLLVVSNNVLHHGTEAVDRVSGRLHQLPDEFENEPEFHKIRNSLREATAARSAGRTLSAGWHLENAETGLHDLEDRISDYVEAKSIEENRKQKLGELRWRARSLSAKIEDRRTRRGTIRLFENVQKQIAAAETTDSQISTLLDFPVICEKLGAALQNVEQNHKVDCLWHEIATDSVKNAARALRSTPEDNDDLRDDLVQWQEFLEQENANWRDAFDSGVEIELEAYKTTDRTGESKQAANSLEHAATVICDLLDWQSSHGYEPNREVGLENFQKARIAMTESEFPEAIANAKLAEKLTTGELALARSRENRAVLKQSLRQEEQPDPTAFSHPRFTTNLTRGAALDQLGSAKTNGSKVSRFNGARRTMISPNRQKTAASS